MKKSDIITTTFVAILGLVISFFVVRAAIGDPEQTTITFKNINVVQKDVATPSSDTFNSQALDPTVEVFVGDPNKKDTTTTDTNNEENKSDTKSDNTEL